MQTSPYQLRIVSKELRDAFDARNTVLKPRIGERPTPQHSEVLAKMARRMPLLGKVELRIEGNWLMDMTEFFTACAERNLRELYLLNVTHVQKSSLSDIAPLAMLRSLNCISLAFTKVADISPLRGMQLTYLSIFESCVHDLSPLQGMTTLKTLDMGSIYFGNDSIPPIDLSPLAGAGMQLDQLWMIDTDVLSLSPLRDMTTLRELALACFPRQYDLSPLAGLHLEVLDVFAFEPVPLMGMTTLRSLTISAASEYEIMDLSMLAGLRLEVLEIGHQIGDLSPLRGMTTLRYGISLSQSRNLSVPFPLRPYPLSGNSKLPRQSFWTCHLWPN